MDEILNYFNGGIERNQMERQAMKSLLTAIIFVVLLPGIKAGTWSEWARERMQEMNDPPSPKDLQTLANFVGITPKEPEDAEIKQEAWERLTRIPDFARQLAEHLREKEKKWRSGEELLATYSSERMRVIQCMENLPDPTVVRELGALLKDKEIPGYRTWAQARVDASPPSNAILAARALSKLVDNPPVKTHWELYSNADVETWELWFEQVKAGTKGFQFKGSDTVHYLATPAKGERRPAASEPGTPAPEKRVMPVERKDAPKDESRKVPLVAILAALGLLALSAAWIAISKRKATAGP